MPKYTFHLLPNAHLDPVWLWDWREGANEALVTCRTILDLMDEFPFLTFMRGESWIYQNIEKNDPETFARIKRYVKQGRWDIIGGSVIQPDTNMTGTETLLRHFTHGKRYFRDRFNVDVTAAWAADSFGHAEGMPEILAAAGMKSFAFSRPSNDVVKIEKSAFWWKGPGGSRILANRPIWGWYGSERHEMPDRLDGLLKAAEQTDLQNVGVMFGLGNHGGGPTRRHIQDILAWGKKHPEVELLWSGLHRLFAALNKEIKAGRELPVHKGELNFVLRGCYSSVAKFKYLYRQAEALTNRAERTDAVINYATALKPTGLHDAWDTVLFNSFHDILPGSSIERAFDDQIAQLGGVIHQTQSAEIHALDKLALKIDTRVAKPKTPDTPTGAAILVWNPHPHTYEGLIELEASLDWRPIWKYTKKVADLPVKVTGPTGKPLPFQVIDTEHTAMVDLAWRKRVVAPVNLPAFGWNVVELAWVEGYKPPKVSNPTTAAQDKIANAFYEVSATPGSKGIRILHRGIDLFGSDGLHAITVEDPWGSWGGMAEEPDSLDLSTIRHNWKITQTHVLEAGPLRSALWVRMEGGNSRLDLTISVSKGREAVDIFARVFWDERSARLKLVMPGFSTAEFDVPGATVTRGAKGEVPGGRWVKLDQQVGFASNALYNFDIKDENFRATICRATRYANDVKTAPDEIPWRPAVDSGELKFKFLLAPADDRLPILARELEEPPITLLVPSKKGNWKKTGSITSLEPKNLSLLALKQAEDQKGIILRVQETRGKKASATLIWMGRRIALGQVAPRTIATFRLVRRGSRWMAKPTNAAEC